MSSDVIFDERFCGFPKIVLGGYVGGMMAKAVGSAAEVRFSKPVKPGAQFVMEQQAGGQAVLRDGENTYTEAKAIHDVEIELPAVVSFAEAQAASQTYPGFGHHLFPNCYCCGTSRAEGDGLRIFPGLVADRNMVAAIWTPDATAADAEGRVLTEAIWSALDCPAGWALITTLPAEQAQIGIVTGLFTAEIVTPMRSGEEYIVAGWPMGINGRKVFGGAAVLSKQGEVHAIGKQTFIASEFGAPLSREVWRIPAN